MAMKLKVKYLDGREVEVLAGPKAQVLTERHFTSGIVDVKRLEHVYYLAWVALFKAGKEKCADFEDFLDLIDDVDNVDDEESDAESNPTQAVARQDGSSS